MELRIHSRDIIAHVGALQQLDLGLEHLALAGLVARILRLDRLEVDEVEEEVARELRRKLVEEGVFVGHLDGVLPWSVLGGTRRES